MAFVSFKEMTDRMRREMARDVREGMSFAAVVALTRTAVKCRDLMKDHMRHDFDRPTPYAVNAARAVPATKKTMAAAVLLKEGGGSKTTPAANFLGPEIDGGARRAKRTEKNFTRMGFLETGGFVTPGSAAKLDQYGNESAGEIIRITSILKAFGEMGYHANRAKGWGAATRVGQIFVVRQGYQGANHGGLKPGVYRRTASGVECLMVFVRKAPKYRVRLPFDELVEKDAAGIFPYELDVALEKFS